MLRPYFISALIEVVPLLVALGLSAYMLDGLSRTLRYYSSGSTSSSGGYGSGYSTYSSALPTGTEGYPFKIVSAGRTLTRHQTYYRTTVSETVLGFTRGQTINDVATIPLQAGGRKTVYFDQQSFTTDYPLSAWTYYYGTYFDIPSRYITVPVSTDYARTSYYYYARTMNEKRQEGVAAQPTTTALLSGRATDDDNDKNPTKRSPSPTPMPSPVKVNVDHVLEKRRGRGGGGRGGGGGHSSGSSDPLGVLRACVVFFALLVAALAIRLIMLIVYLPLLSKRSKREPDGPRTAQLLRSFYLASSYIAIFGFIVGIVAFAILGTNVTSAGGIFAAAIAFWILSFLACTVTAFLIRRQLLSRQAWRADEAAQTVAHPQYVHQAQQPETQQLQQAPYLPSPAFPEQVHSPVLQAPVQQPAQAPAQQPTVAPEAAPTQALAPTLTPAQVSQLREGAMFMAVPDGRGGMVIRPVAQPQ